MDAPCSETQVSDHRLDEVPLLPTHLSSHRRKGAYTQDKVDCKRYHAQKYTTFTPSVCESFNEEKVSLINSNIIRLVWIKERESLFT